MGQRMDDLEAVLENHCRDVLSLENGTQGLDSLFGELREFGEGAFADLTILVPCYADHDGGGAERFLMVSTYMETFARPNQQSTATTRYSTINQRLCLEIQFKPRRPTSRLEFIQLSSSRALRYDSNG